MTNAKQSMFSDRRKRTDRRTQNLSMPAGLDRRLHNRRSKQFQPQPWWLRISYARELVDEDDNSNSPDKGTRSKNNPYSENSDTDR